MMVLFAFSLSRTGPSTSSDFETATALALVLVVGIAWCGLHRGWDTPAALAKGWKFARVVFPLSIFIWVISIAGNFAPIAPAQDKAVLNNARQLAAAADQYYQEHGVTLCTLADLVGPEKFVKALNTVASETYPLSFPKGVPLTITGVAGARTITYAP